MKLSRGRTPMAWVSATQREDFSPGWKLPSNGTLYSKGLYDSERNAASGCRGKKRS